MEIDRCRLQVEFHLMGHTVISNFAFILIQYESSSIVFYAEDMSESGFQCTFIVFHVSFYFYFLKESVTEIYIYVHRQFYFSLIRRTFLSSSENDTLASKGY